MEKSDKVRIMYTFPLVTKPRSMRFGDVDKTNGGP